MPRDVFGNYTLPAGNPVVTGTIISTSWGNGTMNDIATALTTSLSIDGSVTTPKISASAVTTAKIADANVTTVKLADDNVTRAKLSAAVREDIAGKNWAINPSFRIWQAGTSLPAAAASRYLADQFVDASIGTTNAPSQQPWPVGQTDVDPAALFFHRTVVASVANAANFCHLSAIIEGVRTLSGKAVTISFWAKADAAKPIAVSVSQIFGTGGAPSATVDTAASKVTLTAGWVRYTFNLTIPSISGKTIGSNVNDYLAVRIWFDAGSNFNTPSSTLGQQSGTFDIWGVKVEEGAEASTYSVEGIEDEITKCQRFYQSGSSSLTGYSQTGVINSYSLRIVLMRGAPAIAHTPTSTVNVLVFDMRNATSQSVDQATEVAANGGYIYSCSWTLDARL